MATLSYSVVDLQETQTELERMGETLAGLPEGKALRVSSGGKGVYHKVRDHALRLGINISIRKDGDDLFVFRKKGLRRACLPKMAQRNEEIVKAIEAMRTYADIASQFGLSRQRIEQIYLGYKTFIGVAPEQRRAAVLEFMAPYLEVSLEAKCFSCGAPLKPGKHVVCEPCRKTRYLLSTIKSRLKSFSNKSCASHEQSLRTAAWLIRKHGILPEDLRFV